jgi:hypothetical protein
MNFEDTVPPRGTEANWGLPGWCSFVLGGMFTFLLVYIGIARPAAQEVSLLKRQMSTLEQSVWEVAGQTDTAKNTNRLLSLLVDQKETTRQAATSLENIRELNQQLAAEARRAENALATVQQLVALKNAIVDGADQTREAAEVVSATLSLQEQLADASTTAAQAAHSGARLLAMGTELNAAANDVESAQRTLTQIRELHSSIEERSADVATARLRVDSLLTMKDAIIGQTGNLADAIETLELTNDLTSQFRNATVTFENMRRWMVEVVTMESVLERAQNALEPLTELGNLRHLNVNQLRSIARTISRGYQTQVAQKPQSAHDLGSPGAQTAAMDSEDLTLTNSVDIE